MKTIKTDSGYWEEKAAVCARNDDIGKELYHELGVKDGLRDENGNGVLAGLTNISEIRAFEYANGEKIPCDGRLLYRGYDVGDLIMGSGGRKFAFEEAAYLLIFGELPTETELRDFCGALSEGRGVPVNFTKDVIMKAPSGDIMNSMTRSVLTLASYDDSADDLGLDNVLRQCVQLTGVMPMLAVYGYHAHNHYDKGESMYIHRPDPRLSTAENFLRMLRPDMRYTELEARALDAALLLHAEHGGGNNSTFTVRVVTSSGSDTYSAIAAALCSLKGKRHGGANIMVTQMMNDIKSHVGDCNDEEEIERYLRKILNKEAFDGKGLIYGMGHAVYSISDPRERIFKSFVEKLASEKDRKSDFTLYDNVEKIAPRVISEERKTYKGVSPNVDFYSGFVYDMLGIPQELFTPLFAVARAAGWSAHRIEETVCADKIVRPAYKSLAKERKYIAREKRSQE